MEKFNYELIIIGGGPAGLTAGIYAARARLKTLLIEKMVLGGQAINSEKIENYPGFPEGISGINLMKKMEDQAKLFGLNIEMGDIYGIAIKDGTISVSMDTGEIVSKALIIATGSEPNKLGVEGEERLIGRGISFCATCDGFFFKDKEVVVVGGGNRAVQESLFLTKFCSKIYLVHRRDRLRATKILQERLLSHPKIEVLWDCVVQKIKGESNVDSIEVKNLKKGEIFPVKAAGILIFVGMQPNTGFLKGLIELDDAGFIKTDEKMETSSRGIFAAGDVRSKLLRQVSSAVGDGAVACFAAERYIEEIY
ncbi:MAG: thioredoxin-disulfide reductase [Thermodesulfobacteriota bacterium]|nr:thioredoxin-disulfide reductase [Thermodesulfobacteriota bacterium]